MRYYTEWRVKNMEYDRVCTHFRACNRSCMQIVFGERVSLQIYILTINYQQKYMEVKHTWLVLQV